MILHERKIASDTQEVTLCPLGDIQWAGDRGDLAYDHLIEHIDWCQSQPEPLYIGMGDYIDFASPSNRDALRNARVYDTAMRVIKDGAKDLMDECYDKILARTTGRWAGLVEGHHHFPLNGGMHSDAYLAAKLDTVFLEEMGVVCLKFGKQQVLVAAFHGEGQSVFPWGPLVKLFRFAPHANAAVLLMGHQTKKVVGEYDRMEFEFPDDSAPYIEHKTVHLVGTGGWSKGYIPGKSTYVSRELYAPVALGGVVVHMRPRWRTDSLGRKRWDPKITVEA